MPTCPLSHTILVSDAEACCTPAAPPGLSRCLITAQPILSPPSHSGLNYACYGRVDLGAPDSEGNTSTDLLPPFSTVSARDCAALCDSFGSPASTDSSPVCHVFTYSLTGLCTLRQLTAGRLGAVQAGGNAMGCIKVTWPSGESP